MDILKDGNVRSRLVAQEFAVKDRDDVFASTPPLSATRFLLSDYCSRSQHGSRHLKLLILDIKKAFLYGNIEDEIDGDLPDEDVMKHKGMV